MNRPDPIIWLPRYADQDVLIRGLYPLGYSIGTRGLDEGLASWFRWSGANLEMTDYPFVCVEMSRGRIHGYTFAPKSFTRVNSVRHLLHYIRSAQGAAPAQVAGPV